LPTARALVRSSPIFRAWSSRRADRLDGEVGGNFATGQGV
jgi:hypothetical protein